MGHIDRHLSRRLSPPPHPVCACVPRRNRPPSHAEEMAAQTDTLWQPGTTLRIAFRYGRKVDRYAVMRAATEWMRWANIRIIPVSSGPAELRCSFDPGGSWSYVGRECLGIPPDEPTLNMGWPDDPGRDLHELGHALGLVHGQQVDPIHWDREACYRFFGGPPNNWTRAEVDEQVLDRYDLSTLTASPTDKYSIMRYPVPVELVTDPNDANGWNQVLSETDKQWIAHLYPKG